MNREDQTIFIVWRVLAGLGAVCVPAVIWLFSQLQDTRSTVTVLSEKVGNIPQVVENALQRSELVRLREELKSANDNLKTAIQTHEQQQQSAPKGGKP